MKMQTIADIEIKKLENLGKVFNTIIESQKIRIDTKQHEIKTVENRLKGESLELKELIESLENYQNQINRFNLAVGEYKEDAKLLESETNNKIQEIEEEIKGNKKIKNNKNKRRSEIPSYVG